MKSKTIKSNNSLNKSISSKSKKNRNYDVFICHSKKKKDSELFIYYIKEILESKGYKTFIDVDNLTKITPKKLESIVKNIKVLIVIIDDVCLSHKWVRNEVEYALKYKKKIIPIENLDLYKKNDIIDYWTHGDMPKTFNEFLIERLTNNTKKIEVNSKNVDKINKENGGNKLMKTEDGSYWLESAIVSWKLFVNQVLPFSSSYRSCFKNKLLRQIEAPLSPSPTLKTKQKN